MKKMRLAGVCTWLFALLAIPLVGLGVLRDLNLADLVAGADWIVSGHVVQKESRWNDARDYIYSYVTISVNEYWKNPLRDSEIVVQVPGGSVDEITQQVSDTPEFFAGENVVLFLFDQEGNKWVYGWQAGKYTVQDGQVRELGIPLSELKSQVSTILRKGVNHE